MKLELLQQWLGLPAGDWPPDHYALLGLTRGPAAPELVEARALERMDHLRRYQLLHAEEVTEGMNRLAQALDVLTDPESRRGYNRSLGIPADGPPTPFSAAAIRTTESPAEIIPPAVAPPAPRGDWSEHLGREELRPVRRELTQLRHWRRCWDRLRPFLTAPRLTSRHRGELAELVSALAEVRAATGDVPWRNDTGQPGALVLELADRPLIAEHFRALTEPRRTALAGDWYRVRSLFDGRRHRLRFQIDNRRIKQLFLRRVRRAWFRLRARPEWILAIAAALALLVALGRSP